MQHPNDQHMNQWQNPENAIDLQNLANTTMNTLIGYQNDGLDNTFDFN